MNRRIPRIAVYFAAAILTFVGVRLAIPQAGSGLPETLAAYLPPNALMTVEAQDFAGLWRMWNAAPERQLWIASANRYAFLRSSLFYRLKDAQSEFAAAAKLAPDEALVQAVAGDATILAVYDIGALEVAYLTRMNRARATESALWQLRGDFEPREAAGQPYYVRSDEESGRTVAFAATDEYLILATREDLVASILENLASSATTDRLAASPWYRDASAASPGRGGLRLVLDISRLASTPHFRSYWVQQNATELRQYTAGIVDLAPNGGAWEERRAFLRASEATSPAAPARAEATRLAALAPAGASLFRAWAEPDRAELAALVRRKILAPGNSAASIPNDEVVYRRVPLEWYNESADRVRLDAFRPRHDEVGGLSVDLASLRTSPAESAVSPSRPNKAFHVVQLRVGDLRERGLSVEADPIPGNLAHALIDTTIDRPAYDADKGAVNELAA